MPDSYWSLEDAVNGLVDALRARSYIAASEDVQVEPGWPGETQTLRSIWFDEARDSDVVAGMRAGPIKNNEDYTLWWVCDSFSEGGSITEAMAGLTPLVGEFMREIAEKKRIDTPGNKVLAARIAGWRYRQYALRTGRGVACRLEVRITGRR